MHVSHALECNYSCGDFCYIIDTAGTTCMCYQATRGITSGQASKTKAERERGGRETRREQARMHQQTSKSRETSQRRSVNYDKLWIPCIRH